MSDFRLKLVTADGSLVADKLGDVDYYVDRWGKVDSPFLEQVLNTYAREKGVRIIHYTFSKITGAVATVDWLK